MRALNLKTAIDRHSGFCFGVVYAIEMAEDILNEECSLYCLGDIIHNDEEVERLRRKGLQIISHDDLNNIRNAKVLIRAHGEPPSTYRVAIENNIELIDASCPVVLKLQNRIRKSYQQGENIFIYGKSGHAEVTGLLGQTENRAVVFENTSDLDLHSLPETITLYSQTTKNTAHFYEVIKELENTGVQVEAYDTICRQVSNRESHLKKFAASYDKIVFVSGKKSSNGKALFLICKQQNENSFFISSKLELNSNWFSPNDSIGICGATSTPLWLMEVVREELKKY